MESIQEFLEANALSMSNKTAVVYRDEVLSYKELNDRCNQCAYALIARGVMPGDRIILSTKNKLLETIFCYGILKVGAIEVALDAHDILFGVDDVRNVLNARYAVVDGPAIVNGGDIECDQAFFLKQPSDPIPLVRNKRDIACIQYTSGSTGRPKGIFLSHENFLAPLSENTYIKERRKDRVFLQMPLAHAYGKSILFEYIAAGATIRLADKIVFPEEVFHFILQDKISALEGPPSFYEMLLRFSGFGRETAPLLSYLSIGGGAASQRLVCALRNAQPHVTLSNRYGMTETASIVTRIEYDPGSSLKKIGSCGTKAPYVDLKIVDENFAEKKNGDQGELLVMGKNVMIGLMDRDGSMISGTSDGWLRTGDIASIDPDGYLFVHTRKSQIIKSQGYRIGPTFIEDVLMRVPGVTDAAVVGMPHDIYGETVKAFIVRRHDDITEQKILGFCNKLLPSYMMPKAIKFIDAMPMTFSGKVDKKRLVD